MAKVLPQGKLTWERSETEDVVGYKVYYSADGEPDYTSPSVDVGDATEVTLPLEGQVPVDGDINYGITAVDDQGNESDIVMLTIEIDTTPPEPPINPKHSR